MPVKAYRVNNFEHQHERRQGFRYVIDALTTTLNSAEFNVPHPSLIFLVMLSPR